MKHLFIQIQLSFFLLAFAGLRLPFSNALVIPWIQTNYYILDLIGNTGSSIGIQGQSWMINGIDDPNQIKIFFCFDIYYIGGLGILNQGDYLERTYDSLPSHDMISYFIRFLIIDNWQPNDKIIISFRDTDHIFTATPANLGTAEKSNTSYCGNSMYPDQSFFVINGKFFHNVGSLTVRITSNLANNERSFAIRGVRFTFRQKSSLDTENSCVSLAHPSLSPNFLEKCNCTYREYLDTNTNSCKSCHTSCYGCYGPTEKDCYHCDAGYTFNGQSCVHCSAYCFLCSGSGNNECNLCFGSYILNPDSTCKSTCNAPYNLVDLGDYKMCTKTACQVNGTFLYPNGSCLSVCPSPFKMRIEQMVKFCDRPCDNILDYYYEDLSRCKSGCEYPYKKKDDFICIRDLSEKDLDRIESLTSTLNTTEAIKSCVGKTVSLINFGNPAAFFLEALTNMLKYIRYMKIKYPPKLQAALDANIKPPFSIIPEIPEIILSNLPLQPLPEKFEQYELHSSFIVNFWESNLSLLIVSFGIILSCILEVSSKNYKSFHSSAVKIKEALKWNFFLGFFTSVIGEIVLFTSMEFRTSHLNTLAFVSLFNCILLNIFALVILTNIIRIICRLRKSANVNFNEQHLESTKINFRSYEVIFQPYKQTTWIHQAFMCIFVTRSYLFNLIIAYLFDHPLVQTIMNALLSLSMILYLAIFRPLKKILDLAQYILQEFTLLIINICVLILSVLDAMGNQDFEARRLLGDIIIYLNLAFSIIGMVYFIIQSIITLKDVFKAIQKYFKSQKQKSTQTKESSLDQSSNLELTGQPSSQQMTEYLPRNVLRKNLNLIKGSFNRSSSLKLLYRRKLWHKNQNKQINEGIRTDNFTKGSNLTQEISFEYQENNLFPNNDNSIEEKRATSIDKQEIKVDQVLQKGARLSSSLFLTKILMSRTKK